MYQQLPRKQANPRVYRSKFSRYMLPLLAILLSIIPSPTPSEATTPTTVPKPPVITAANAKKLKQVDQLGEGIAGGGLAYSPDGKTLAVSGSLGVWLYDTSTSFDKPPKFLFQNDWVHTVAFNPKGKILAAAGEKAIQLWDARAGTKLATFPGDTLVAFSPDGQLLATRGLVGSFGSWPTGTVRLFNVATGAEISVLEGDQWSTRTTDLAFSPDGKLIAAILSADSYGSGCGDDSMQRLQVWRMKDVLGQRRVKPDDMLYAAEIGSLHFAFSPNNRILVHGGATRTSGFVIWNTHTHSVDTVWPEKRFAQGAFSSTSQWLAAVEDVPENEVIRNRTALYDTERGKLIRVLDDGPLSSLIFSKDNANVVGLRGNVLRFIDVLDSQPTDLVVSPSFTLSVDGSTVLRTKGDDRLQVIDLQSGTVRELPIDQPSRLQKTVLSKDGKLLATVDSEAKIHIWNTITRKLQTTIQETFSTDDPNNVRISFNAAGTIFVTQSPIVQENSKVTLWNASTGKSIAQIPARDFQLLSTDQMVIFAQDKSRSYLYNIDLWYFNVDEASKLTTIATVNYARPVTASSAGNLLIYRDLNDVYLYSLTSDTSTHLFTMEGTAFRDIFGEFSADGSRLALAEIGYYGCGPGIGRRFFMYDTQTLTPLQVWSKSSTDAFQIGNENLTFNPTGDVFVSITANVIHVWDVKTAKELVSLSNHVGHINRIAFSTDGTTLLSQSDDGTIRRWQVK